jgi:hypothetical protein
VVVAWLVAGAVTAPYLCERDLVPAESVGVLVAAISPVFLRHIRRPPAFWLSIAVGLQFGVVAGVSLFGIAFRARGRLPDPAMVYACVAAVSVLAAWWVTRPESKALPLNWRTYATLWGWSQHCLACCLIVYIFAFRMQQMWRPLPVTNRLRPEVAYDLLVRADPPELLWTDWVRLNVLKNVNKDPLGVAATAPALGSERLWPVGNGGFYVQTDEGLMHGAAVDQQSPTAPLQLSRLNMPPDFRRVRGLAEDSATGQLVLATDEPPQWAFVDPDGTLLGSGDLSGGAFLKAPFVAVAPSLRQAYISNGLYDGSLHVLDLDQRRVERQVEGLYMYYTVVDAQAGMLWGTRILLGDLVGIDLKTLEIRERIPLDFFSRKLLQDPRSRRLYTCSQAFGTVFEVNPDTGAVTRLGRCGISCRGLALDVDGGNLWAGALDGICRYPLPSKAGR